MISKVSWSKDYGWGLSARAFMSRVFQPFLLLRQDHGVCVLVIATISLINL